MLVTISKHQSKNSKRYINTELKLIFFLKGKKNGTHKINTQKQTGTAPERRREASRYSWSCWSPKLDLLPKAPREELQEMTTDLERLFLIPKSITDTRCDLKLNPSEQGYEKLTFFQSLTDPTPKTVRTPNREPSIIQSWYFGERGRRRRKNEGEANAESMVWSQYRITKAEDGGWGWNEGEALLCRNSVGYLKEKLECWFNILPFSYTLYINHF